MNEKKNLEAYEKQIETIKSNLSLKDKVIDELRAKENAEKNKLDKLNQDIVRRKLEEEQKRKQEEEQKRKQEEEQKRKQDEEQKRKQEEEQKKKTRGRGKKEARRRAKKKTRGRTKKIQAEAASRPTTERRLLNQSSIGALPKSNKIKGFGIAPDFESRIWEIKYSSDGKYGFSCNL